MAAGSTLIDFQVSSWLPRFRKLAYKTVLLQLSPAFVEYLQQDGITVTDTSAALPTRVKHEASLDEDAYQDWSESDEDPEERSNQLDEFSGLLAEINDAIATLGEAVSPKLNWSCPKDAVWISTGNTHKCTNAEEVILLLKASDRISHDVSQLNSLPSGKQAATLALRKWHGLSPEREFRCFVVGFKLVGISQRIITEHFPGLLIRKEDYLAAIIEFFEQHLRENFRHSQYTFDIYVTSQNKVRLIDFSPVGGTTNPLLFTWEELDIDVHAESIRTEPSRSDRSAEEAAQTNGENGYTSDPCSSGKGSTTKQSANACDVRNDHGINSDEDDTAPSKRCLSDSEVVFRVVTEKNNIQPNMPTYGVPYDLVEPGAYDSLLSKLQEHELEQ